MNINSWEGDVRKLNTLQVGRLMIASAVVAISIFEVATAHLGFDGGLGHDAFAGFGGGVLALAWVKYIHLV